MAVTYTQLNELYLAYFGRPVDFNGYIFYTNNTGSTEATVSAAFSASAESQALYGTGNVAAQVNAIYKNLFNRDAEIAGLTYWTTQISSGVISAPEAALVILRAAVGTDSTAVANKIAVSKAFFDALDTSAEAIGYSGTAAAASARAFIATVTFGNLTASVAGVDAAVASAVAASTPPVVGQIFPLTTGLDTFTGGAGNDTINGGTLNTFSAFDSIDGGAGTDTLSILTDAAALPGGVTVKNVENISVNASAAGAFTANTSSYTGIQNLNVTSSSQGVGTLTVDSPSAVTVNSSAATTGAINVGATTAATGAVSVAKVITGAGNVTGGAITVKGGTTVTSTTTATNSATGTAVTQGDVTVTGTAVTTSASVNQSATVAAVTAVTAATESATVDFGGTAAQNATVIVAGLTLTVTDAGGMTGAEIAAAFANLAAGATGPNPAKGTFAGTLTGYSTGAVANTDQITFTSTTANTNVTDLTVGGSATITGVTVSQGAAAVTGVAGVTAGAVSITDVNAASLTAAGVINYVSLNNFGASTVNSGALATLALAGKGTSVTETAGALTTATATTLTLNLHGVTTTGAVTLDADHTTLNIHGAMDKSTLNSLSASGAKTVNISGDKAVTLSAQTLDAAATITSTNTAGVTLSSELGTGVTFNGGAGAESVKLGASTKATAMGAGADTVELSGSALGANGTAAGGDGRDTLVMTAANAITATAGIAVSNFSGKVTGFEILQVGATAGAGEIKVASLDNTSWNAIDTVTFAGAVGHATTVSGLASGDTVGFKAGNTAATTATVTGALASTADVLNLSISNTAGINVDTVNAADIETINFLTDDSATTATGIQHTAALTAAAVKTITVAGDAGLALTNTATTVTSFDASGVTKGAVSWTAGILAAAATITGSATQANTIVATDATKAVTYTGGTGVDNITINNAQANVINTGAGNDIIVVGNGANTISAGAGNDTITLGSGANSVNTGDGVNTVVFSAAMAGLNTITLGSGVDTLDFNAASTAAGYYPSVTGIAAGDKIDFAFFTIAGNETTLGAKITLGGAASFANYLDAAAASNGATAGTEVNWFQLNGNTYLVLDNDATSTFKDGTDLVIELVGTVDLTASTFLSSVVTIV